MATEINKPITKQAKKEEIKEVTKEKSTSIIDLEERKKEELECLRLKDRVKVKGIFKFYECSGAPLRFVYRKYKKDPIERFDLQDGEIYTLPLGVAKHLNKNGQYPIHEYLEDEHGKVSMKIGQKVRRFGFQSLEFIDVEELSSAPSRIVTVENV